MARELGLTYEVVLNLHNLGDFLVHLDDLPRAYGAIRQSLALCDECGFERLANHNRMFLAFLDGVQGTVDGEKLLRQGIALRREQRLHLGRHRRAPAPRAAPPPARRSSTAARDEYEKPRALARAAGHRLVADDCDVALQKLEPTVPDPSSRQAPRSAS